MDRPTDKFGRDHVIDAVNYSMEGLGHNKRLRIDEFGREMARLCDKYGVTHRAYIYDSVVCVEFLDGNNNSVLRTEMLSLWHFSALGYRPAFLARMLFNKCYPDKLENTL